MGIYLFLDNLVLTFARQGENIVKVRELAYCELPSFTAQPGETSVSVNLGSETHRCELGLPYELANGELEKLPFEHVRKAMSGRNRADVRRIQDDLRSRGRFLQDDIQARRFDAEDLYGFVPFSDEENWVWNFV